MADGGVRGKVHIVQLLCPSRHCLVATAYEEGERTFDEAAEGLRGAMRTVGANDWCGICGSHNLKFEDGVTRFATLKEAMPYLETVQAANLIAKAVIGGRF